MAAGNLTAKWYDPRNGTYSTPFNVVRSTNTAFSPPGGEMTNANDWAIIIESI